MNKLITEEVKQAIYDFLAKENLSQARLATLLEIKPPSVNNWLNGRSKRIDIKTWVKLEKLIKEYLPINHKLDDTLYNKIKKRFLAMFNNSISDLEEIKNTDNKKKYVANFKKNIGNYISSANSYLKYNKVDDEIVFKLSELYYKIIESFNSLPDNLKDEFIENYVEKTHYLHIAVNEKKETPTIK